MPPIGSNATAWRHQTGGQGEFPKRGHAPSLAPGVGLIFEDGFAVRKKNLPHTIRSYGVGHKKL